MRRAGVPVAGALSVLVAACGAPSPTGATTGSADCPLTVDGPLRAIHRRCFTLEKFPWWANIGGPTGGASKLSKDPNGNLLVVGSLRTARMAIPGAPTLAEGPFIAGFSPTLEPLFARPLSDPAAHGDVWATRDGVGMATLKTSFAGSGTVPVLTRLGTDGRVLFSRSVSGLEAFGGTLVLAPEGHMALGGSQRVASIDRQGSVRFVAAVPGFPPRSPSSPDSVTIDSAGNITAVVGHEDNADGGATAWTRLAPDGRTLWVRRAELGKEPRVFAHGDGTVVLFLCDPTLPYCPREVSIGLARFDGAGNLVWRKILRARNFPAWGFGVVADSVGNIVLASAFEGWVDLAPGRHTVPRSGAFVARFDSSGRTLGSLAFAVPPDKTIDTTGVSVGAAGEITLSGRIRDADRRDGAVQLFLATALMP